MPTITNPGVIKALVTAYLVKDRDKGLAMREVGYSETYSTTGNCTKLFERLDVTAEIRRQEVELLKENGYSVQEYQQDLKEDRSLARTLSQPSAAVSATVAMGRSMGHDKDNDAGSGKKAISLTEPELTQLRKLALTTTNLRLRTG